MVGLAGLLHHWGDDPMTFQIVIPDVFMVGARRIERGAMTIAVMPDTAKKVHTALASHGLEVPVIIVPREWTERADPDTISGRDPHFILLGRKRVEDLPNAVDMACHDDGLVSQSRVA